jgi:hypothetical protein
MTNTPPDLVGRWRIVEMDRWDRDAIELLGTGFFEINHDDTGRFGFIAVEGWMDCRPLHAAGGTGVEFTWEGSDECDHACGRGIVSPQADGSLRGHIYFHRGEDSAFRADRETASGRR